MTKIVVATGLLAVSLSLVAACSSGSPARKVVTITVPPSDSASSPSPTGSGISGRPPASPSASVTATDRTSLGGTCDTLLSDFQVANAVGKTSIPGTDSFVVGVPEADIGRRAYLNCQYGVTGTGAKATSAIEIGISLYSTPARAAARIAATVSDYSAHGAQATDTTVAGQPAQLLTGGTAAGYTDPLLVVADAQETVAVSVAASIATGTAVTEAAVALAELALTQTAG